jgi:hypothetical protein
MRPGILESTRLVLVVLAVSLGSSATELTLADGRLIKGSIASESSDTLVVRTAEGVFHLCKRRVVAIDGVASPSYWGAPTYAPRPVKPVAPVASAPPQRPAMVEATRQLCSKDTDCSGDLVCVNGGCVDPGIDSAEGLSGSEPQPAPDQCSRDMDCPGDMICDRGLCVDPENGSGNVNDATPSLCGPGVECPQGTRCLDGRCVPQELEETDDEDAEEDLFVDFVPGVAVQKMVVNYDDDQPIYAFLQNGRIVGTRSLRRGLAEMSASAGNAEEANGKAGALAVCRVISVATIPLGYVILSFTAIPALHNSINTFTALAVDDYNAARRYRASTHLNSEAETATLTWLAMLDAGKYQKCWDATSKPLAYAYVRKLTDFDDFEDEIADSRDRLGSMRSRERVSVVDHLLNGRRCLNVSYRTVCEDDSVVEIVQIVRGTDDTWRVCGYMSFKTS